MTLLLELLAWAGAHAKQRVRPWAHSLQLGGRSSEVVMAYGLIDAIPTWLVFLGGAAILALSTQLGRVLGSSRNEEDRASQGPLVGTIVAALLALLGLLLAFAFGAVESRFAARKQLILDEANAIGTTYLRAGFLEPAERESARTNLRAYVDMRVASIGESDLSAALRKAEDVQKILWQLAEDAASRQPRSEVVGLFVTSLNELIDLQQSRVTVAVEQRLPITVLVVLAALACLSLAVLGYAAGLARARARFPSAAIIAGIAAVVMMIIELDRPFGQLFRVKTDAMRDVQKMVYAAQS